jgi:hypothetical protein
MWNIMFAVSCVIAVSMDPLFFYLPIVNRDKKCVWLDKRLKIIAYSLRSVTDLIYLLNIILQFICPYIDEVSLKLGRTMVVNDPRQIAKRYFFSRYFVIDVLAILPIPQVRDTFLLLNCFANVISSSTARRPGFYHVIRLYIYVSLVSSYFSPNCRKTCVILRNDSYTHFLQQSHNKLTWLVIFYYFFTKRKQKKTKKIIKYYQPRQLVVALL